MDRREVFNEICDAFEQKYSWLGRQFAEEFLYTVASYILHRYIAGEGERIRSHLLLYWRYGWLKSSLLYKAYMLLGNEHCEFMTDITKAALRGSIEHDAHSKNVTFVPPKVLRAPFIIATELGAITAKNNQEDVNQLLLAMLEEGIVTVDLIKFAKLTQEQREEVETIYGITFRTSSSITYTVNSVILAGTYNPKYAVDPAFVSRWEIMYPKQELDVQLIKHIEANKFLISKQVITDFRNIIKDPDNSVLSKLEQEWNTPLPDAIYSCNIPAYMFTPRIVRSLKVYKLAKLFWGLDVDENILVDRLRYIIYVHEKIQDTLEDQVIEFLRKNGRSTFDEIKKGLGIPSRELAPILKRGRDISTVKIDGKTYYFVNF